MADSTSIVCRTFGDILSIVENRAKVEGTVQDRIHNFFKGIVNEKYIQISTERNWYWRKFDRAFVMSAPIKTPGTVSVTNGSREAIFSALVLDTTYLWKSIRIGNDVELYRIVGIDSPTVAILEAPYVRSTNVTASFNIYQYEFPLPPDCDVINQVYVEGVIENGALEERNVLEFNRMLSRFNAYVGTPIFYCKDGKMYQETIPPLDRLVVDYDFLGGNVTEQVDRIRIFPISPDRQRLVHLNYSIQIDPLKEDADEPIMPFDNRWILVHAALAEWWKINGDMTIASAEMADMNKMLREMRDEHQKTDPKPKLIVDVRKFYHTHSYNRNRDLLRLSRLVDN